MMTCTSNVSNSSSVLPWWWRHEKATKKYSRTKSILVNHRVSDDGDGDGGSNVKLDRTESTQINFTNWLAGAFVVVVVVVVDDYFSMIACLLLPFTNNHTQASSFKDILCFDWHDRVRLCMWCVCVWLLQRMRALRNKIAWRRWRVAATACLCTTHVCVAEEILLVLAIPHVRASDMPRRRCRITSHMLQKCS